MPMKIMEKISDSEVAGYLGTEPELAAKIRHERWTDYRK